MAVMQQPMGGGVPKLVSHVDGNREWSSGVLGCFSDFKTCIMAYFCLPCTICNIASRTGDCPLMPFCVPGGLLALRTRIRTLGGIRGSICMDCLVLNFCQICAICQMARELDHMGL